MASCLESPIKSIINQAKSDEERVAIVLPKFCSDEMTTKMRKLTLQQNSVKTLKREKLSGELRKKANKAFFEQKDNQAALLLYTDSIAYAPHSSTSNPLAFSLANRSMVLKAAGKMNSAIADIQEAIAHDYPLSLRHKLYLREAQCYQGLGDRRQVLECTRKAEECLEGSGLAKEAKERELKLLRRELRTTGSNTTKCKPEVMGERPELPALSYGASQEAPCLSQAVRIEHNEAFGRHLVATRDIKIGDVLLVEEAFGGSLLFEDFRLSHCNHCSRRSLALLPCQTCDWALYCSAACREEASRRYHRAECLLVPRFKAFAKALNREVGRHAFLAIRIIASVGLDNLQAFLETREGSRDPGTEEKGSRDPRTEEKGSQDPRTEEKGSQDPRIKGFNAEGRYESSDFTTVYNLETSTSKRLPEEIASASYLAWSILKVFDRCDAPNVAKLAGLVMRLILSLRNNACATVELQLDGETTAHRVVGCGLYPTASMASHSCAPNITCVSYGSAMVFRALQPIREGAQVLMSYGATFDKEPKHLRQQFLRRYFFTCECEACANDWPLTDSLPDIPEFSPKEKRVEEIIRKSEQKLPEKLPKSLAHFLERLRSNLKLYEQHLALMNVHGKTMNKYFLKIEYYVGDCYLMMGNFYDVPKSLQL